MTDERKFFVTARDIVSGRVMEVAKTTDAVEADALADGMAERWIGAAVTVRESETGHGSNAG